MSSSFVTDRSTLHVDMWDRIRSVKFLYKLKWICCSPGKCWAEPQTWCPPHCRAGQVANNAVSSAVPAPQIASSCSQWWSCSVWSNEPVSTTKPNLRLNCQLLHKNWVIFIRQTNSRDHKGIRNTLTVPTFNQALSRTQCSTPHFWNKCLVMQQTQK